MRPLFRVRRSVPLALLAFATAVGCADKAPQPEKIVPVTGTVTHKGRPVANLMVHFVPQTGHNSYPSHGKTDENGRYTLTNFNGEAGAHVGTHKVWVNIPPIPPEEDKKIIRPKMTPELTEIVKKYGTPDSTPLTFEVKEEQVIDLRLD